MILSDADLLTLRTRPHSTRLHLSIYQPSTLLACQVNDAAIVRGARTITYDNVTAGSYLNVEADVTMLIGTSAGASDVGNIRVRSITSSVVTVAENSDIDWADDLYLTILNYVDVRPIFTRIIQNPADEENVIFYKDYDIEYTNQNSVLGSFPCAGPHRAAFLEGGTASLYWSASGTANVNGDAMTYAWEFEGGTPTGSVVNTPGYVTYDAPGHYRTKLVVSNAGGSDTTYRYVSIYNRQGEGTSNPILKWEISEFSGSRAEGGYTARIKIWETIPALQDNALVVIFADDWYGSANQSLGGNALNSQKIVCVGYILKGSIEYNYRESFVEFEIGSITEVMKLSEGFSVSCESKESPATWFEIQNMTISKAIYHYLRWHSTVLKVADFEFAGDDLSVQYLDTERESLFDAIDNFVRLSLIGEVVADRQGKIWVEVSAGATHNAASVLPIVMSLQKQDWIDSPDIEEARVGEISYLELGGIAFSGATGTFAALMSGAPGTAPAYHGKVERQQGLVLLGQDQLNTLAGDVFAYKNAQYPSIQFAMAGNYRNLDIAPLERINVNIAAEDTVRGIALTNSPFHINGMTWRYNAESGIFMPVITLHQLTSGIIGTTIPIPKVPPDTGFHIPPIIIPPIPPIYPPPWYFFIYNAAYINWVAPSTYTRQVFGTSLSINATENVFIVLKTGHYLVNFSMLYYYNTGINAIVTQATGIEHYPTFADYIGYTNVTMYWGPWSAFTSSEEQDNIPIVSEITRVMYLVEGNVLNGGSFYGGGQGSYSNGDSPAQAWYRVIRLD